MSGSLAYLGSVSLGALCPTALSLVGAVSASLGPILVSLQAQVAGIIEAQAHFVVTPPTFTASLNVATALIAALDEAVAVSLPGVDFQIAALAQVLVSIQAQVASVEAAVSLGASITALLAAGGIYAYAYTGTTGALGSSISAATGSGLPDGGGSSEPCNALLLATATPATWTAMRGFFAIGGG